MALINQLITGGPAHIVCDQYNSFVVLLIAGYWVNYWDIKP